MDRGQGGAPRLNRNEAFILCIDYLQLLRPPAGMEKASRENQVAELSRRLKAISKDYKLPILLLAQLNRESEKENRAPRMSDLRESGAIEGRTQTASCFSIATTQTSRARHSHASKVALRPLHGVTCLHVSKVPSTNLRQSKNNFRFSLTHLSNGRQQSKTQEIL